jgi:hypothetical protein
LLAKESRQFAKLSRRDLLVAIATQQNGLQRFQPLFSDSFNRYFNILYYDWSALINESNSEAVVRLGDGVSSKSLIFI